MEFFSKIAAVFTAALLLVAVQGQTPQAQDCASKLTVCINDLNSTKPSTPCCNAIKEVYDTQLACLCGLYSNPALLAGINITQALELPKHCSLSYDTNACKASGPASAPGSSAGRPPATPGGNRNAAGRISWMGMPALLVVSALAAFY